MVTLSPLNKKLLRDIWRIRGQVLAIAMVIGAGVATLVMSLSTVGALQQTAQTYYERYQFADVFAHGVRVPNHLKRSIEDIPGVQAVQTRITRFVTVDVKHFNEPIIGQIMSIPGDRQPGVNQLVLRKGRWVSPHRSDEVLLNEPFAEAHNIRINDKIQLIMNGTKRTFVVVGFALSPEFIYAISPGGLMPDDLRFGVMWMNQDILEAAFDLDGSFNDVALTLMNNGNVENVIDQLDDILAPYGGLNAIHRADQISNWFVMNEIAQQKSMATILPGIFIIVSIFLTNMVLNRLIATERTEIGLLKAFGYSSAQLGWQYTKLVLLICLLGIVIGAVLGTYLGRINAQMYADLFRFPLFIYRLNVESLAISGGISAIGVLLGALSAVKTAASLPPAVAMSPPSPPVYKRAITFNSALTRWLDQPSRIALRQIGRWPFRSFFTSVGIALSAALIIMNLQWSDSLAHLSRVFFFEAQKQDMMVGLPDPATMRAIHDFEQLPGVMVAEPMRIVSVQFRADEHRHKGAISGILSQSRMQPIYDDAQRTTVQVPPFGLMMSTRLAQKLEVSAGDYVEIEVLEGKRNVVSIPIAGVFETFIGLPVFMDFCALHEVIGESPRFTYANLRIDSALQNATFAALKDTPKITAVLLRESALNAFKTTVVEHLMVFISMFVLLACILTFGVVYNSTRISLSERARELATLRVLGFSKGEISYVLLGEVMCLVVLGLPLGCLFGWVLVLMMANAFDTEMFRIPLVIDQSTYGIALLLVLAAACVSAAIVRRRVDKLDLIKVLKTRE